MESMSITRFELYKIFSRKSIWILLAIMLVGIILPLQLLVASSDHPPVYQPTQPTPQQVQQAKTDLPNLQQEIQQSGGGRPAYWKLWHQYQSAQAIVDSASGTAVRGQMKLLQQSITKLKSSGRTGFTYRADKLEYTMLKNLPFIGGGMYNGGGAIIIDFFKTYGFLIYGAMILIGLSSVFSEEYAIGTDSFLLTAKNGKRQIVTAKIKAASLYTIFMGCIVAGVNVIMNAILFGTQGLDYPLQSIPLYSTPFHLSILQYIGLAIVIQLLSGLAFSCVVLLVSAFNRSSLISFFISAGIFALPELIVKIIGKGWAQTLMNFSYTGLMEVSRLFYGYIVYNLFGHPILYPLLAISLMVIESIPIVWLVYRVYSSHQIA